MNKYQRIILTVVGSILTIMLLFPPFNVSYQGTNLNQGFHFIFTPPKHGEILAVVYVGQLLAQWLIVITVGGITYYLAINKNKDEDNEIHN